MEKMKVYVELEILTVFTKSKEKRPGGRSVLIWSDSLALFPRGVPGAIQAHTKLRWTGLKRLENPCKRNSSEAQS